MIDEINTIYDLVVGIDLLKTNFESEYLKKIKNNIKIYNIIQQKIKYLDYMIIII